jgi:hypothetical protein
MSVVKVIELIGTSEKSWEDAVQQVVKAKQSDGRRRAASRWKPPPFLCIEYRCEPTTRNRQTANPEYQEIIVAGNHLRR